MNSKTMLSLVAITTSLLVFSGCGSSSSDTTSQSNEMNQTENNMTEMPSTDMNNTEMNSTVRFESVMIEGDSIERDNQTKLDWVASTGTKSVACSPHAAPTTEASDVASAQAHCDALTFAGYSDWRVPTVNEHITFIQDMDSAGKMPYYLSPLCHRVIGVDNNTTAMTVNTHNTTPLAATTTWSTLMSRSTETNFGVKCVRDF